MVRARGAWAMPAATRRHHRRPWYRRLARRLPRGRWGASLAAAAGLLLLYLLAMCLALLLARRDITAGMAGVEGLQSTVSTSRLEHDPQQALSQAQDALQSAAGRFDAADRDLLIFRPVLRRLSWFPLRGQQIAAAPDAALMAAHLTHGALDLIHAGRPVLAGGSTHLGPSAVLADLDRAAPDLENGCGELDQAQSARANLSGLTDPAVVKPLQHVDGVLPGLATLCHALIVLPGVLGDRSPGRYLIVYENPSQLRATGGYVGSVGLLTFRHGHPAQKFTGTWLQDNLSYLPPAPIRQYNHEPGWLLRDSNWSPDFPTSAALERFFARLDLGWQVQGVIDVTPQATADLLSALGGFYSPEYHRWIDGGNVARLTDYYTHDTRNYGPLHNLLGDTARKQFIQIVADHLFGRLTHLRPADLVRLGHALTMAVPRGDVLMNFNDPAVQAVVDRAGASGRMDPTTADFLQVVDSNLSYNKINPYIHLDERYQVLIRQDRWLQANLTLRFTNVPAPAQVYRNSFGPGAGRAGTAADYSDFVRVYVPAGAQLLSSSGWQNWPAAPAYGKTMFSGYLIVRKGQTRTVHLSYTVPPNVFSWSNGSRYRLTVGHQPGSHPLRLQVQVTTVGGTGLNTTLKSPDQTWTRTIAVPAVPFTALPLPKSVPSQVKPGHYVEPYAYLGKQQIK